MCQFTSPRVFMLIFMGYAYVWPCIAMAMAHACPVGASPPVKIGFATSAERTQVGGATDMQPAASWQVTTLDTSHHAYNHTRLRGQAQLARHEHNTTPPRAPAHRGHRRTRHLHTGLYWARCRAQLSLRAPLRQNVHISQHSNSVSSIRCRGRALPPQYLSRKASRGEVAAPTVLPLTERGSLPARRFA